jgi:hypothetical protein
LKTKCSGKGFDVSRIFFLINKDGGMLSLYLTMLTYFDGILYFKEKVPLLHADVYHH